MVGAPAGGLSDVLARLLGQWLSEQLSQQFIVENRPGAATNIATELVVRAPADGHTLLIFTASAAINASLYDKLNFIFTRDITPVAAVIRVPGVLVINSSVPAKTVPEFIAYAKANSGRLSMASAGNGSPHHIYGELFKMLAGVDLVHVPYRGGALALTGLLGGQVEVMFSQVPEAIEHVRAGRLRPLAVTTTTTVEVLPGIPTLGDFLSGYEASGWQAVGAPKNTPAEIIDLLNMQINRALADPKIKAHVANLGGTVLGGTPADLGKLIADETEKWANVVKFSGAKPD